MSLQIGFLRLLWSNLKRTKMGDSGLASGSVVQRLGNVEGFNGKFNDVLFNPATSECKGRVVFFGGDVQDYPENMLSHRDNKRHLAWNLENTTQLLSRKFPNYNIFIIRPVRMHLKTFSCFENFVPGDDIGSPQYQSNTDCLSHLKQLLANASTSGENCVNKALVLVGFSKGCVVLNQVIYSLLALKSMADDSNLGQFVTLIEAMYWLDGGHSGGSNTWVTDKNVLKCYADTKIKTRIHVTPYQMDREARPWVGREEKQFRENLKRFGADLQRKLHFEDKPASLNCHFQVLEAFEPDLQAI